MNGWSDALRQELQPDVHVVVVESGASTEIIGFALSRRRAYH